MHPRGLQSGLSDSCRSSYIQTPEALIDAVAQVGCHASQRFAVQLE